MTENGYVHNVKKLICSLDSFLMGDYRYVIIGMGNANDHDCLYCEKMYLVGLSHLRVENMEYAWTFLSKLPNKHPLYRKLEYAIENTRDTFGVNMQVKELYEHFELIVYTDYYSTDNNNDNIKPVYIVNKNKYVAVNNRIDKFLLAGLAILLLIVLMYTYTEQHL